MGGLWRRRGFSPDRGLALRVFWRAGRQRSPYAFLPARPTTPNIDHDVPHTTHTSCWGWIISTLRSMPCTLHNAPLSRFPRSPKQLERKNPKKDIPCPSRKKRRQRPIVPQGLPRADERVVEERGEHREAEPDGEASAPRAQREGRADHDHDQVGERERNLEVQIHQVLLHAPAALVQALDVAGQLPVGKRRRILLRLREILGAFGQARDPEL